MRLGKKEAAGYVADTETDEIQDVRAAPAAAPVPAASAGTAAEPAAREPESAATTG